MVTALVLLFKRQRGEQRGRRRGGERRAGTRRERRKKSGKQNTKRSWRKRGEGKRRRRWRRERRPWFTGSTLTQHTSASLNSSFLLCSTRMTMLSSLHVRNS